MSSPALQSWVAGISVAVAGGAPAVDVPDHATTLVLRTDPAVGRSLIVMGPRTRASYHVAEPGASCVRVRLRPGRARALLGRSVQDLADRALPVLAVPGLDLDWLAVDPAGALEAAFVELPDSADLVAAAAELLTLGNVQGAARRLHLSERRLRTIFADGMGLSPKHFARIARVRVVLGTSPERSWADVAASAGYYDQSHMTAEFRRLMGVSPAAFVAGRRPVATRCDTAR